MLKQQIPISTDVTKLDGGVLVLKSSQSRIAFIWCVRLAHLIWSDQEGKNATVKDICIFHRNIQ